MSAPIAVSSMGREPATVRVAMWSARHRWPVAALWFLITIGIFVISQSVGGIKALDANTDPNERQLERRDLRLAKVLVEDRREVTPGLAIEELNQVFGQDVLVLEALEI